MLLRALISALFVLLAAAHASAEGCSGCCCGKFGVGPGGSVPPPRLFAYGCYFGDGTNARLIPTGINASDAGALLVNKVTTSEAFCNRWLTQSMVDAGIQGRGLANCTTNEDANLFSGFSSTGFVVNNNTSDPGDSLNENLEQYCWYEWNDSPGWNGNFTYTGDGTSPRTIALGVDLTGDSAAWIQNRNNGDGFVPANGIVMRSSNMPANASYLWNHVAAASSDANAIQAFTATGITVGSHLNETGVAYYGTYWHWPSASLGGVYSWTGNGTAGGGNCGTGANVQVFANVLNGDPTGVLSVEDFFAEGCSHQECDSIRALNLSPNFAGPGNIPGTEDWYAQPAAAPDDIDLGYLLARGFAIRGGSTTDASCNDNTQSYFAGYWTGTPPPSGNTPIPTVTNTAAAATATRTATGTVTGTATNTPVASNTPTPTPQSPADWCANGSLTACWGMDEASNTTRASTGSCTTDCALTNNGTVTKDVTAGHFVTGTGGAASDAAVTDNLSCAPATCDEINLSAVAGATWGCFGYVATDAEAGQQITWTNGTLRYDSGRNTSNNNCQVRARNAGGSLVTATTGLNTWTAATQRFCAATFDDANNELKAYAGGSFGSTQTLSDIGNTTTGTVQVAGGDTGWTGTSDECFVARFEMADDDLCRMCSCGGGGSTSPCTCNGASYISSGVNATVCGSCTLPACNKVVPSGINTPTPTNTGVVNTATRTATSTSTPTVTQTPTPVTVVFGVSAANVCTTCRDAASYPPGGSDITIASDFSATKSFSTTFGVCTVRVKINTGALPTGATILSATASLPVVDVDDTDNRSLTAAWWDGSGSACGGYTATAGTDANAGIDLTGVTVPGALSVPLLSPNTNISTLGFTGLQFFVSGGSPTGLNALAASPVTGITLTVTYTP